jgi:tetratricopeptide (TPR) repeat protein
MSRSALATLLLVGALAPSPLVAQRSAADAALAAGRLAKAESLYFRAARLHSRDPEARRDLGNYLAARGALRVGAVLLEEARMFGGDARRIARDLAPLYRELGDWSALATLPASPLAGAEREQARWLVSHSRTIEMPESVTVEYRSAREPGSLGEVAIAVGRRTLTARIEAGRRGVVLDERLRGADGVTVFGTSTEGEATGGAVQSLRIGALTLEHVPVSFAALGDTSRAVVGLDVLRAFAPTFDPAAARLTLRRGGRVRADVGGTRYPTLIAPDDVEVLRAGRFVSIAGAELRDLLRMHRWTIDARRGELVVE